MSSRAVVLIPADSATNVELVTKVALVAAPAAEIHVLDVEPRARPWHSLEDRQGNPWVVVGNASARNDVTPLVTQEGTIGRVRLRGTRERIIPGYAELTAARAIVMDRHYGTSPLWRNTAMVARISRWSPVPVLVLPSEGPAVERLARGSISRIVTAVDSTLASAVALRGAAALATRHDARLMLLHVFGNFPDHSVFSGGEAWRLVQQLPAQQRQIAKRFESQARRSGQADAVAHVITGDAALGITTAASEANADLLVIGVAPRTWFGRSMFGSTLGRVLRRTDIPVLVIPVMGGEEEWSETMVVHDAMGVCSGYATRRIAA